MTKNLSCGNLDRVILGLCRKTCPVAILLKNVWIGLFDKLLRQKTMRQKILLTVMLFILIGSGGLFAQPVGNPPTPFTTPNQARSAWYRGGNVSTLNPAGFNIFGFTDNEQIWHQTNSFNRMVMWNGTNGGAGGRIGFGNDLPVTFDPRDRLHSHITVAADNFLRFTNPSTNLTINDGFRVGLSPVSDVALFDQMENSLFRFDILSLNMPQQLTKFTIDNINQSNATTTYQPTYMDATRVGIWENGSYFPGFPPLASLHIGQPSFQNQFIHRDWMNLGTYYNTSSDGMYVGMKENTSNGIDAVVAWGDDGAAAGAQGDRLKFIFASSFGAGTDPAYTANGLEVARYTSDHGINGGAIFNNILGIDPLNTVHIVGPNTISTTANIAGGNSGLRLEYVKANVTPTVNNPGTGVLSVDANGDVIYVNCCTATGSITAQNGLNMINPTTVEMGGSLLHATDVTQTNPTTLAAENIMFNGKGQFAVSDYSAGTNSSASSIGPGYRFGIFDNTYPVASRVENIRATTANSAIYGEQITLNVNINPVFGFPAIGETVTAKSDGASVYGVTASASPNTFSTTSSGTSSVVGVQGVGQDGYHTYGGIFRGSTILSTGNPTSTIASYGIDARASGGDIEAIGGIFFADKASFWNKGVYAIARVDPSLAGRRSIGVHGLADGGGGGGYNIGVWGIGNEFDPTKPSTTAVGVGGILGSNSWGLNYFPPGLRAGVFGSSAFAVNFGSGSSTVWAGYFDGNVFTTGNYLPSDRNLKSDIKTIDKSMDIIKKLNPVSYNFKTENKVINLPEEKQYGFISQEVKEILPELTKLMNYGERKDSAGNVISVEQDVLTLNYNAFIAILTKGIQEQQTTIEDQDEKINDLQQQIDELKALVSGTGNSNTNSQQNITLTDKDVVVLNQNVPNPFAEQTTISYNIPENTGYAQILFYSMNGQLIKVVEITEKGEGRLNVFASDLSSGIYTYTLIIDGKNIESKKMTKL